MRSAPSTSLAVTTSSSTRARAGEASQPFFEPRRVQGAGTTCRAPCRRPARWWRDRHPTHPVWSSTNPTDGPRRRRRTGGSFDCAVSSRRARRRMPVSSAASDSTSPSRWTSARISPRAYGTNSSTTLVSSRTRSPIVVSSSSIPSPVVAEIPTEPGWRSTRRFTSGLTSDLLKQMSSGTVSAPISARTSRTASTCDCGSATEPSTTWTSRSASAATSSVERNASTS